MKNIGLVKTLLYTSIWLVVASFLLALPAGAFVRSLGRRSISGTFSVVDAKAGLLSSSSSTDPTSRFHSDMKRVLQSREKASATSTTLSPTERRQRPETLSEDIDGAERVHSMLKHMVGIGIANEETYRIVLEAFTRRGRLRWRQQDDSTVVCAADVVGPLLDDLRSKQQGKVSAETCDIVLKAYATCATPRGRRNYAQKAQALLHEIEASWEEVSVDSFLHVINAWSWQQENRQPGDCAKMAQENFERMQQLSPSDDVLLQSYDWLLEAWSKSSSDDSAEIADKIFRNMLRLAKKSPTKQLPNAQSYSNVILAWTKRRGYESAQKAQALLEQCLQCYENEEFPANSEPELIAFNGVISAWARIGCADKAEEALWTANDMRTKCTELAPDVKSFNSVLHAYVRSKDKKTALDRILSIVEYMEENMEEHPEIRPDGFTYTTVLKAWAQSRREDALEQALLVLQNMRLEADKGNTAATPKDRHYNIVINLLAKRRRSPDDNFDASQKAYELLRQMQTSKDCSPDIISYTSVIECLSKSTDPSAAETSMELLEEATNIYEETGDERMMPNLRTYTMAINSLSTNPTYSNVVKATELLERLESLYRDTGEPSLQPNAFPYNYVLNCASNCIGTPKEKLESFKLAARTYNEMRKADETSQIQPDSFTYAFWFKCCNNLLPVGDLRIKGITYAFEQCCQDGLLSEGTLKRLLAGSPPALVAKLLNLSNNASPAKYRKLTLQDVPPHWSRNVKR